MPTLRRCLLLIVIAGTIVLAGCLQETALIQSGTADEVDISYASDPSAALPLARQYCAQFEKVPQLVNSGVNVAVYHCHPR